MKLSFERVSGIHEEQTVQLQKCLQDTLRLKDRGVKVVLVGGSSGTGKSHLVQSTIANGISNSTDSSNSGSSSAANAWYASSKFDQGHQWVTPFGAALDIVTDITEQILASSNDSSLIDPCRMALIKEFSSSSPIHRELLVELIPRTLLLLQKKQEEENDNVGGVDDCRTNSLDEEEAAAGESDSSSPDNSGNNNDSNNLFTTDHIKSTRLALRSFLRAVSTVLPTILLIDDIMWSDNDTLEVFKLLLTSNDANVLFFATYRDDEVPLLPEEAAAGTALSKGEDQNPVVEEKERGKEKQHENPFVNWQKALKETLQEKMQMVFLKHLEVSEIQRFLCDALRRDYNEVGLDQLAKLLHARTNGNVFYLIQMLENLCDLGLIKYEIYSGYHWTFSLNDIQRCTSMCDNVGQLVCSRIGQLERPVQDMLKLASCFGATVELQALEITQDVFAKDNDKYIDNKVVKTSVSSLLERACQEMMLIPLAEGTWKFAHDQIQAAAYDLAKSSNADDPAIEGTSANQMHWQIGHSLLHHKGTLGSQGLAFACADQLRRGFDYFDKTKKADRVAIAELSLVAGKKAASMSAFLMASDFFKLGIDAMGGPIGFEEQYGRAVKLYSLYARAEQCGGSIAESKMAAETILSHAKTQDDKVTAYRTLLSCFLAANKIDELIDFGLELCEKLGEKIPKNPKPRQVRREVEAGRKTLLKTSNAQILSLPPIEDKNKELCMNVLFELSMPAYYVGNHLLHYTIVNTMNKITLRYGLSKWSSKGFALSGQHFTANYSDFKEGHRYAQLALVLLGNYKATKSGGGVLFHVAIIRTCMEPCTSSLDLLLDGYKMSMDVGNVNFAFTNIFNYFWTYFYSGLPFEPLLEDIAKFSTQMLDYNRHYMFLMALPVWQCLLNLSGQAKDRSIMEGGDAMLKEALVGGNPKGAGRQTMMSYWMQLSFYLGNLSKATGLYEQVKGFDMGAFKATMFFNARIFFFALIEMHNFRETGKRKCRKNAKKYRDILRKHVAGGAINLVHKVQLLEAEIMKRTSKNTDAVLRCYRSAIVSATRSGFLQDAALANYLCAQYCQSKKELSGRHCQHFQMYVAQAYENYASWGATAVAESLKDRHPEVFEQNTNDSSLGSTLDKSDGTSGLRKFGGYRSSCKFSDLTKDMADEVSSQSSGNFGFLSGLSNDSEISGVWDE